MAAGVASVLSTRVRAQVFNAVARQDDQETAEMDGAYMAEPIPAGPKRTTMHWSYNSDENAT